MDAEIQEKCLQFIIKEWKSLPQELQAKDKTYNKPWGIWIGLYEPIPRNWNNLDIRKTPLRKAWFFDERKGLQERSPWEYIRFLVVNLHKPWWSLAKSPPTRIFGDLHEIAQAGFSKLVGEDKIYIDTCWGWKWGTGYHVVIDENNNLQIQKEVWRS